MTTYRKPPQFKTHSNEPRRVGFEFEFGNLLIKETAEALHEQLGGTLKEQNPFNFRLHDSVIGNVKIERDVEILTSAKYRDFLLAFNIDFDWDEQLKEIEQGVDRLSSWLIPCEVVTEPLLFEAFPRLDDIVAVLHRLEAKGTQASVLYAFGLHLNPSLPDRTTTTLLAFVQAFLLLSDWLVETADTDFSRRFLTSYIDPFPDDYVELILTGDYRPNAETFCDDYLRFNPTRNRALDLLPILYEANPEKVLEGVRNGERTLLSGRPAFHYRLPDCRLGDDSWSISAEWNRWWCVERLAADAELRAELTGMYHENQQTFFLTRKKRWFEIVDTFCRMRIVPSVGVDG